MPTTTAAVFDDLRKQVKDELVQRDAEVDAITLGLVSQQHVLFVGEPGIGKTLVARRVACRIDGARTFYIPFGPFTSPEKVFGNISIQGLKADRQLYVTKGKLPEAEVGIFDEWTRAGNAVLQEMLLAWNEREFEQDGEMVPMPLMTGIFLSNHLPDLDKEATDLGAVYDRILLRYETPPVIDAQGLRDLDEVSLEKDPPTVLTLAQLKAAQEAAAKVHVPKAVTDARVEIFGRLMKEGLRPSNRRYLDTLSVIRATAFLDGRDEATPEDCDAMIPALWHRDGQFRQVQRLVWEISVPGMDEVLKLIDALAKVDGEISAALDLTDESLETGLFAAGKSIKRHARKVKRLQGKGPKTDAALADVWRRLQVLQDRIFIEGMEVPTMTLDAVLSMDSGD